MGSPAMQSVYPTLCSGVLVNGYTGAHNITFIMTSCILQTTSEIRCLSSVGVGYQHHVVITCGGQSSLPSEDTLSYAAPTMTDITPTPDISLPTAGGGTWTITGDNFGSSSLSSLSSVRLMNGVGIGVAGFSLESTCSIQSSTKVICDVPAGVGQSYTLELTIGGQSVDSSSLSGHPVWSYDAPTITSVSLPSSMSTMSTNGGDVVTITGTLTSIVLSTYVNTWTRLCVMMHDMCTDA